MYIIQIDLVLLPETIYDCLSAHTYVRLLTIYEMKVLLATVKVSHVTAVDITLLNQS